MSSRIGKSPTCLFACNLLALFLFLALPSRAQTVSAAPAPELTLSANNLFAPTVSQGWPIVLELQVNHPDQFLPNANVDPVMLSTSTASWTDAVQITVQDASGTAHSWPFVLVPLPAGTQSSATLSSGVVARLFWTLSPSNSQSLTPGIYQVAATLDTTTTALAGSFNGRVQTSASVTIAPEPSPLPAAVEEDKFTILAAYDLLQGNDSLALGDANTLLTNQPNNSDAMLLQGDLLMAQGQVQPAIAAYEQANSVFAASFPNSIEPAKLIDGRLNRARAQMISQAGTVGVPQIALAFGNTSTQSPGVLSIDLTLSNNGTGVAEISQIFRLSYATLAGTGKVAYDASLSPAFPFAVGTLDPGASTTVTIFLDVPASVGQFTIAADGQTADELGTLYDIHAMQAISANSSGGGNLPGALTIQASNATRQYGSPAPSLNNVTYIGFVNGDTSASLTGTLNCTTTAQSSSPAGTYPVTCSGLTSQKYTITFVPGALSITPAPLTVTANNASRAFGQSNPPFTGAILGFVNGDTSASVSGSLSCTSTATSSSSVSGSPYPINCAGVSSSNYAITFVPGLLTITKATPLITWSTPADITQGTALGSNQLNATANVAGNFVYAPPAGTLLPVGPSQLLNVTFTPSDSTDYNGASASATIKVTAAALGSLTITASNATRQYGQASPPLNNVTYNGFASGDTPASLTGTLGCTTTANSASSVGTYPITCSGLSSPKYAITFIPGKLTITPANLSVIADNATRPFGQSNPTFTGSFSGLVNGDSSSALSGTLSCSSPAITSSPVSGSPYAINCSAVSSSNYAITFLPGQLAITKATPTITWNNPADIAPGVPLGTAQLNATASVPGTFVYTPLAGTVLPIGNAQPVSVVFAATDSVDYNSAAASVTINVKSAAPVPGDLNGDGAVGCDDLAIVKASFGKKTGQPGFDPRADVNGDGIVNILDLTFVSKQVPAGTVCK
jgi:hypothetical protein